MVFNVLYIVYSMNVKYLLSDYWLCEHGDYRNKTMQPNGNEDE